LEKAAPRKVQNLGGGRGGTVLRKGWIEAQKRTGVEVLLEKLVVKKSTLRARLATTRSMSSKKKRNRGRKKLLERE